MKKIFITIIMIFTLCVGAYAKHTPLYKNSISMEGIGAIGGTPPAFNRAAPGTEFAPNKHRQY